MTLSVIGLGKLGACTAACFSAKGYKVIGVDISPDYVDAINQGKAPVLEPRLQELIDASKGRLTATTNFAEALTNSDITFLIVPTPSRPDGHFSDHYLLDALKPLSEAFKTKNSYHTFVVTSTVSPGTIDKKIIPFIEKHSGKKVNKDFGVAYNPEFIALGSVITDFLNPDMVLIGESCPSVGVQLEAIYKDVCEVTPYIARMSLVSAEIAKISVNSYVTTKISFANTLASLCEGIHGANIDDITEALGADKRISPYYLKGGLGFGGPCFPRDNRAFAAFAADYDIDARIAKATDLTNHDQTDRLCRQINELCTARNVNRVSIFGLAYKPNTPVVEESPSMKLISKLLNEGREVTTFDPLATEAAKIFIGNQIDYAISMEECLQASSIYIFMTTDPLWQTINHTLLPDYSIVIDCWRLFSEVKKNKSVTYIRLGEYHPERASRNTDAIVEESVA